MDGLWIVSKEENARTGLSDDEDFLFLTGNVYTNFYINARNVVGTLKVLFLWLPLQVLKLLTKEELYHFGC